MLWTVLFKPRLGKVREVVVEASAEKARAVAEAWAVSQEGTVVGEVKPLAVADESILPVPAAANGGARPIAK